MCISRPISKMCEVVTSASCMCILQEEKYFFFAFVQLNNLQFCWTEEMFSINLCVHLTWMINMDVDGRNLFSSQSSEEKKVTYEMSTRWNEVVDMKNGTFDWMHLRNTYKNETGNLHGMKWNIYEPILRLFKFLS